MISQPSEDLRLLERAREGELGAVNDFFARHRDLFAAYYNVLLRRPASAAEVDGWLASGLGAGAGRAVLESSPECYGNG
jgi:hypothetical protein